MIFPVSGNAPLPNSDLPGPVLGDYNEARAIAVLSPRGAAALLRLAIQKLCQHLGEKGANLNEDIGNLVKKGLSPKIQRAMDIVRVIGNNAVHPGQVDLKDDASTVGNLFHLVNLIAEEMISTPNRVEQLYQSLPEEQRKQIEKRDAK